MGPVLSFFSNINFSAGLVDKRDDDDEKVRYQDCRIASL